MKRALAFLLLLAMILSLTACGNNSASSSGTSVAESANPSGATAENEGLKFGICVMMMTNEYMVEFAAGAEEWCNKNGIETIIKDGNDDISKQVSAMEDFINAGCDAIVISALDDEALRAPVKKAVDLDIPVITETIDVEGCTAAAFVDEHDFGYALGENAGKWAQEHFPGEEVQFAVMTQTTIATLLERSQGIVDGVIENCPTAVCVSQQDAYTTDKGVTVGENILTAYPDVKMILCVNDMGSLGAYEVCVAKGYDPMDRTSFFLGGCDGDIQARKKVEEGSIYQCTIAFKVGTPQIGAMCAEAAYVALQNDGKVDDVDMPFGAYTYETYKDFG